MIINEIKWSIENKKIHSFFTLSQSHTLDVTTVNSLVYNLSYFFVCTINKHLCTICLFFEQRWNHVYHTQKFVIIHVRIVLKVKYLVKVDTFKILIRTSKFLPKRLYQFSLLPAVYQNFHFLIPFPDTV